MRKAMERLSPLLAKLRLKGEAQLRGYFFAKRKPGAPWQFIENKEEISGADCCVSVKELLQDPEQQLGYVGEKKWTTLEAFVDGVLKHDWD
jgi:hypothetical protein